MYREGSGIIVLGISSNEVLGPDDARNELLGIDGAEAVDRADSVVLSIGIELLVAEDVDLCMVAVTKD